MFSLARIVNYQDPSTTFIQIVREWDTLLRILNSRKQYGGKLQPSTNNRRNILGNETSKTTIPIELLLYSNQSGPEIPTQIPYLPETTNSRQTRSGCLTRIYDSAHPCPIFGANYLGTLVFQGRPTNTRDGILPFVFTPLCPTDGKFRCPSIVNIHLVASFRFVCYVRSAK